MLSFLCSILAKKLTKLTKCLSEGVFIELNFLLKEVSFCECCREKSIVYMRLLKLLHNFFLSGLKFFIGLGTKDKSLVKTENFF